MPKFDDVQTFPCYEAEFTKDGGIFGDSSPDDLASWAKAQALTDLFVFSHGWRNNIEDARGLVNRVFKQVNDVKSTVSLDGRKFGILVILWPALKFGDSGTIPSGAAGITAGDPSVTGLQSRLERLKGAFNDASADTALDKAKMLVPILEKDAAAREEFVDLIRSILPKTTSGSEDASTQFFSLKNEDVLDRLRQLTVDDAPAPNFGGGGAAGIIDGIKDAANQVSGAIRGVIASAKSGADSLLNYTTYYQMKERAGLMGRTGVYAILRGLRDRAPSLKLHLIGHSFGARLVTSATLGPNGSKPLQPETLTLLQAAFSHNGFAPQQDDVPMGAFHAIASGGLVTGPILDTFTKNDQAVGLAYPLASRLSGDAAAAIGDADDKFGGLGSNGAQHSQATVLTIHKVGVPYTFVAGKAKIHNLLADVIKDHNDIDKPEVAYALLSAIAKS